MSQKGFTLVELVVVTGIIIFLSAMLLVNWRPAAEEFALQRSAHKLAQDIRRASEMAMSAREFQGSVPQGGYGFHVRFPSETESYVLYADTNGNQRYDAADGIVETVYLEQEVIVHSVSKNNLSINFKPPNPTVSITPISTVADITLALKSDPTKIRSVIIHISGLIEIEE
ncbi:MAG: hypothetical protein G01um101430_144 [Parcubacteria group bacterium Gr01-1014_30]|nr:MAG: hypothetical protein G01um101430_144 [Parcubacteria group bacterium Gr01-1014_30]